MANNICCNHRGNLVSVNEIHPHLNAETNRDGFQKAFVLLYVQYVFQKSSIMFVGDKNTLSLVEITFTLMSISYTHSQHHMNVDTDICIEDK